jgi:hypothetical protein
MMQTNKLAADLSSDTNDWTTASGSQATSLIKQLVDLAA